MGSTRLNRRLLACLIIALASFGAGWYFVPQLLSQDSTLTEVLLVTALWEILVIGVPALCLTLKSPRSLERVRGTLAVPDSVHTGLSMLGAVAFTMAGLLITLLTYIVLEQLGVAPDEPNAIVPQSVAELLMSILCAAAIPAVCEELFFRGVMYTTLAQRIGHKWAAALSGVLFAGLHFTLLGFPVLLALGLALANIMRRRSSLILCVLFHAMYNLTILVINFTGGAPGLGVILFSTAIAGLSLRFLLKEEKHAVDGSGV